LMADAQVDYRGERGNTFGNNESREARGNNRQGNRGGQNRRNERRSDYQGNSRRTDEAHARQQQQKAEQFQLTEIQKKRQPSENDLALLLKAGALIAGARVSTHMAPFIFDQSIVKKHIAEEAQRGRRVGQSVDTLESVFDLRATWNQLNLAATFLASVVNVAEQVLFVAQGEKASVAVTRCAKLLGARSIIGRYVPGSLTNPQQKTYCEPSIIVCSSASRDAQVIRESSKANCAVIALCDAEDSLNSIDVPVPCNTTGRLSVPLMFYLLARQTLRHKGAIAHDQDLEDVSIDHFVFRPQDLSKKDESDNQQAENRRGAAEKRASPTNTEAPNATNTDNFDDWN